ncbi:unnamed protein product [Ectocarpus sp. 4 AP-2014]
MYNIYIPFFEPTPETHFIFTAEPATEKNASRHFDIRFANIKEQGKMVQEHTDRRYSLRVKKKNAVNASLEHRCPKDTYKKQAAAVRKQRVPTFHMGRLFPKAP